MKSILISLSLILTFVLQAQNPTLPENVKSNIEKRIEYGITPSIVVGIIDAHGTSYFNFGTTKIGGAPVDEHSIYEIGSISKVFTATLLADNIVKKQMSADDPAQQYLPEKAHLPTYEGKSITLGHLSDHTSSLPRMPTNFDPADPMNPYADYSVDQLYDFLSTVKLERAIGSEYEYSNVAVGLLGQILAQKAGVSYEELMLAKIATPLKMNETKITFDQNMFSHLAYGYANGVLVPNWDLLTLAGAGAIRSSTHDLLLFLAANIVLASSELTPAMELAHQVRHDKAGNTRVGLGWHISKGERGDLIWHNGATGGYRAFMGFSDVDKKGVVVMTNSDADIDDIGFHLLFPERPLADAKPNVTAWIKESIDEHGTKKLVDRFEKMKKEKGDHYSINENDINSLGYWYMNEKKNLPAATAIFEINMKEFPSSFNVYDSYAEALMNAGNNKEAIEYYKKSLELNPGNINGVEMLAKMGVVYEVKAPELKEELLKTYDGTYEIAPGFNIVITHQGTQLFGQATGQPQFELFPKSETEFYLKVVEARVTFAKNGNGEMGMTLYQNGAVMPGKKI
jgi:CubicO group peptidase (beta-lactamase class C family)